MKLCMSHYGHENIPDANLSPVALLMKLCMSHYGHENIPDANLSPVALLVFEIYDIKLPSEKGNKSSNSAIPPPPPGKWA